MARDEDFVCVYGSVSRELMSVRARPYRCELSTRSCLCAYAMAVTSMMGIYIPMCVSMSAYLWVGGSKAASSRKSPGVLLSHLQKPFFSLPLSAPSRHQGWGKALPQLASPCMYLVPSTTLTAPQGQGLWVPFLP